jgi:ribosomal protein L37AE/L43A
MQMRSTERCPDCRLMTTEIDESLFWCRHCGKQFIDKHFGVGSLTAHARTKENLRTSSLTSFKEKSARSHVRGRIER